MDKYEYTIKSDKIKKLVDRREYEMAARIADTIDWEKVKNAKMLSAVSVAYEKAGRLQEARDVLLLAYECAPVGRRFLYKLTELAAKQGNFDEAEEYLKEYAEVSPHDPGRLLLRYEIAKSKKEQPETLIMILEAYHKRDFDEKWSYELAELYFNVGKTEQCVKLCDEIVLWFGVGTYVDRALELKQRVTPLSPDQIEKQENREKYLRRLEDVRREFEGDEEPETKQTPQPDQKKKNKPQTLEERISQALKEETVLEEADGAPETKRVSPLEELKARHPEIARAHQAEAGQRRQGQKKQSSLGGAAAEKEQPPFVRSEEEEPDSFDRAEHEEEQETPDRSAKKRPVKPAGFSQEEERLQAEMEACLAREIETAAMSATIDEAMLRETAVSMEAMEADENDHSDISERTKVALGHFSDQSKTREFVLEARDIKRAAQQPAGEPVRPDSDAAGMALARPAGEEAKPAEIAETGNGEVRAGRNQNAAYEEPGYTAAASVYEEQTEYAAKETSDCEEEAEYAAEEASDYEEKADYAAEEASGYGTEAEYAAEEASDYGIEEEYAAEEASDYEEEANYAAEEASGYGIEADYAAEEAGRAADEPVSVYGKSERTNHREICDHYVLVAAKDEEQGLKECVSYIRRMRELLGCPVTQLAKIRGDRLAQKDIRQILKKLEGRDLVVAGMEDLPDSVLEQMIEAMAEDQTESFVALIGTPAAVKKLRGRMAFFADCRTLETVPLPQPDEKPNRTLAELVEEALKSCSLDAMLEEREEKGTFDRASVKPDEAKAPASTAAEEIRKRRQEKRRKRQAAYSLETDLARERCEQETAATMDEFPGMQEAAPPKSEQPASGGKEQNAEYPDEKKRQDGQPYEDRFASEEWHGERREYDGWNNENPDSRGEKDRRPNSEERKEEYPGNKERKDEYPDSQERESEYPDRGEWEEEYPDSEEWNEERPDSGEWKGGYPDSQEREEEYPDSGEWEDGYPDSQEREDGYPDRGEWEEEYPDSEEWNEERPDSEEWEDGYPDRREREEEYPGSKEREEERPDRRTEARKPRTGRAGAEAVQRRIPASEGLPANDFFEFAVDYAHTLDAVIDDMGSLAFYAEIEQYQQDRIPLTEELAQEMIEKAILRAEKRSFKSLFTNRYDKEGYLILREEHFKE